MQNMHQGMSPLGVGSSTCRPQKVRRLRSLYVCLPIWGYSCRRKNKHRRRSGSHPNVDYCRGGHILRRFCLSLLPATSHPHKLYHSWHDLHICPQRRRYTYWRGGCRRRFWLRVTEGDFLYLRIYGGSVPRDLKIDAIRQVVRESGEEYKRCVGW